MTRIRFYLVFCAALLIILSLVPGCDDDNDDNDDASGDSEQDDDDDNDDDASPEPPETTVESIIADYAEMVDTVATSMNDPQYFHDGTWHQHYGDANMYGPSFDLASSALGGPQLHFDRAIEALDTDMVMVDSATSGIFALIAALGDIENISMATMGLLEAGQFIEVASYTLSAETLIDILDGAAGLFDDYLPPGLGEFAGATYGPTAISSMIALLQLNMVLSGPPEDAPAHLARAEQVLEHIHERAWSDELHAYRFAPDDDRLMLYPNATMMLAYGRALWLGGNPEYAERIAAIFEGIQPLRDEQGDHYHSPYSAEEAGAVDEDYATLSSQNYLMTGLWMGYLTTGEVEYLTDIDLILGWIESHLFVDDVLKHHWVNGRTANEEDLYDFCSGCNLQTLYLYRMFEFEAAQGG